MSWGHRKRFADGKIMLPYGQFLGYKKGEDNTPVIVEKEAEIVRKIYKLFLEGKTPSAIARWLTEEGYQTPAGKKVWQSSTVTSILKNEKYKGDAILQKSYTVDFLTKKKKINEGELPQYYVENSHPAIITPETFELVQEEFRRRKAAGRQTSSINCFASRIVCGDCGGFYGRKVWHSTSKYANTIWQCNNKFSKRKFCTTPHIKEEVIKKAFVEAFNSIIENRDEILENYEKIIEKTIEKTINTKAQEKECCKIDEGCTAIEAVIEKLISENARNVIAQNEYNEKYTTYATRFNELQNRRQKLNREIAMCSAKHNLMKKFIEELKMHDRILAEFDEGLWCATLNTMVIKSEENVVFQFKGGMELEWTISKGYVLVEMDDKNLKRIVKEISPKKMLLIGHKKINVCAYIRVSTSHQGQLNSLQNQKEYYERKLMKNPDYEYCGIFSDSGISGAKEERPGFLEMIEKARQGEIDLIFTKSVSRFARNIVLLLKYVRELKILGVGVIFEEPIIEKELWECVQLELERQKKYCIEHKISTYHRNNPENPLSAKIICSVCGSTFVLLESKRVGEEGRKYWRCGSFRGNNGTEVKDRIFTPKPLHRASQNPEVIRRWKGPKPRQMLCTDIHIEEDIPEKAFIKAWNRLVDGYEEYMHVWKEAIKGDGVLKAYRAEKMMRLAEEYGRIDEMSYELMLKTLGDIEVMPDGIIVRFLAGAHIGLNFQSY